MLPGQNWNNITAKYFGKQRMRDKSKVKLLKCYYSKLTSFLSKLISVSIVVILAEFASFDLVLTLKRLRGQFDPHLLWLFQNCIF